ncbi:MAG TPA: Gldg family protein [Planctomycetota bacterium]|nr:Gldg family protein [Planctomycetota bacterium]
MKSRALNWLNWSLMIVFMAAFLVGVNLVAHTRFARIDMTTDKVWEITPQSRQILKSVPRELSIYVNPWFEGVQDKSLPEAWRRTHLLLFEMANQNSNLKVGHISEGFKAKASVMSQMGTPEPNSIYFIYKTIEDKPVSRVVSIGDLYQGNPQTGDIIDYIGESRIITTIAQLISDRKTRIYHTIGHREVPPNVSDRRGWSAVQVKLTALENAEFKPLDLARDKAVPDDADFVLIVAPVTDFTTVETDALTKYWQTGGRLFVAVYPLIPDPMTEFRRFLETVGVKMNRDIVVDGARELQDPGKLIVRDYGRHPVNQGMFGLPFQFAFSCSVDPNVVNKRMQAMALFMSSRQTWGETDLKSTPKHGPGDRWGPVPLAVAAEESIAAGRLSRIVAWGGVSALTNEYNLVQDQPNELTLGYILNNMRWLMEREVSTPTASRRPRMKPFSPPPGADTVIGWISLAGIPFIGVLLGGLAWYFRRK